MVEHLTFNQVVGGSNPPCLMSRTYDRFVIGLFCIYLTRQQLSKRSIYIIVVEEFEKRANEWNIKNRR